MGVKLNGPVVDAGNQLQFLLCNAITVIYGTILRVSRLLLHTNVKTVRRALVMTGAVML